MFYFRPPSRPDEPEPLDPVQVERERRILFAPPGHIGPFPTYEEVRAELADRAARGATSDPARTLAEAGFGPPVRVAVVHDLDGDVEVIVPVGTAILLAPAADADGSAGRPEAEAEQVHPDGTPGATQATVISAAGALQHTKDTNRISGRISSSDPAQDVDVSSFSKWALERSLPEVVQAPSLEGLSDVDSDYIQAPISNPKRTRRRPPTPRKSDKKKPKPERLKTISNHRHEEAVTAYLVAQALGFPFNVALDFNPGIDHLDHAARLRFWADLMVNIRSYIRSRCRVRGKPYSWWVFVFMGARESKPNDSSGEHLNGLTFVPDAKEFQHLLKHLKKMRKKDERIWCHDIVASRVDSEQRIDGKKIGSRLDYVLKNAHRDTRAKYPYMIYERSGFITGERVMISTNLTDPKVVASVEERVATLRRLRDERRSILIAEILRRDAPPYPWE